MNVHRIMSSSSPETPFARQIRRTDPTRPPPPDRRNGIALMLVLGILAILSMLVISFTLTVRMERLSARNYRDKVNARHMAELAVNYAMEDVDLALGPDRQTPPPQYEGRLSPFGFWFMERRDLIRFDQSPNVLGSSRTNAPPLHTVNLFEGAVTNLVPAALWDEASPIKSYWTDIPYTNRLETTAVSTNSRMAFLVIDLSGFLDAHHVTSNMLSRLPEYAEGQFEAYAEAVQQHQPVFSLPDLAALTATGSWPPLVAPIQSLSHVSYDPGPEVFFTNNLALGSRAIEAELFPRFNLHQLHDLLSTAGSGSMRYDAVSADYLRDLTNHLAAAGMDAPAETAWNLINALDDHDFVPRSDSETPWREHYGIKPTPRLNEFVLFEVPSPEHAVSPSLSFLPEDTPPPPEADFTNHYALAVELWYPFVPHVLETNKAQLVVGVFTNNTDEAFHRWAPVVPSEASALANADDVENHLGPFGFIQDIPPMAFDSPGDFLEFAVLHSREDEYIHYPVLIRQFIYIDEDDHWLETTDPTDDIHYLPLGFYRYTQREPEGPGPPYPEIREFTVTGTNTVWFQARVRMRAGNTPDGAWRWVDEAFSDDAATFHPFSFAETVTSPVAWSVDDPRRNTLFSEWAREAPSLGERNPHSTVDGDHSAGLPIFIPNGPFERIGDIGSVSLGGETNHWRTLDLTTLAGAHLLDRLTLAPTNAPAYGRVHVGTTQTNVIRALLADLHIGWRNAERDTMRYLTDTELETLTDAWFEARENAETAAVLAGWPPPRNFAFLFDDIGQTDAFQAWQPEEFDPDTSRDIKEQVLRGLVDRLSFRQNIFLVIGVGQSLSPARRVVAEHRLARLIVRDAYTGRWMPLRTFHLDE